jgi:hypothetical protein
VITDRQVRHGCRERFAVRRGFAEELRRAGLSDLDALSSRALGDPITDCRSSWVRRMAIGTTQVYVKTYDYPSAVDQVRGLFRTTFLSRSRARAEWDALLWMRAQALAAPEPLLVAERRRHGLLRRAVLVTEAYPGTALDRLLPSLAPADRDDLLRGLEQFVDGLHRRGFRDRNLDLRNLLARRLGAAWEIVKIDSPRHRLTVPGPAHDRHARADWDRLSSSMREVGLL